MNYNIIILVIVIYLISTYNFRNEQNIKYMSFYELVEYNYKLFLINNAGITYLNKNGSKILDLCTNDPLLIKMHRYLNKKYGKIIVTYIITKSKNYYILDTTLAKKILNDSPKLFNAGQIKENFFKKFMPYNVGISKCTTNKDCPWKKRRIFNENVLGTDQNVPFFSCIQHIIIKHIKKPLLNISDFKKASFDIVSEIIYGFDNKVILKEFINKINSGLNITTTNFYDIYIKQLHSSYNTSSKCSLLYYANMYKNDNLKIIDNQIPHWFGPFIFIISFLIPNLLCIILNSNHIYNKLITEIKNEKFSIFSKKSYLHYCVIEHIRLFNTININIQRTVKKNMEYNGIYFTEGDQVFILFSSILRDKREFKNPDQFIPERWKERKITEQNIVFGIGPQHCPSKQITPIFYKAIIYHLLKTYKYKDKKVTKKFWLERLKKYPGWQRKLEIIKKTGKYRTWQIC